MIPELPNYGPIRLRKCTLYFIGSFLINVVLNERETITSMELSRIGLYLLNEGFLTPQFQKYLKESGKRINFLVVNHQGQKLVPHWYEDHYVPEGEDGRPEEFYE